MMLKRKRKSLQPVCFLFVCVCVICVFPSELHAFLAVKVYTNLPILPFRAGVARTAEGQEDKLMWMLTSFSLYVQMPSTGTEKMLYVNW